MFCFARSQTQGQAAVEFLSTYGWAILVVLAAIGALAHFGVLTPDRLLPDRCMVEPGFSCPESAATASQVQLVLVNNLGKDLTDFRIRFRQGDLSKHSGGMATCGDAGSDVLVLGDTGSFLIAGASAQQGYENAYFVRKTPNAVWRDGTAATLQLGTTTWNPTPPPQTYEECAFSGRININFRIFYKTAGGTVENQVDGSVQVRAAR